MIGATGIIGAKGATGVMGVTGLQGPFDDLNITVKTTQLGLDIDGKATSDWLGSSVSMNALGDRVAIGAQYNDYGGAGAGQTIIYEYKGTSWIQLGSSINGLASERSGFSVSMNALGDRVAIGAPYGTSHVRIYQWSGTAWNTISPTGGFVFGAGNSFGYSVSMNALGDRVAIGAPTYNSTLGLTVIYEYKDQSWVQIGSAIIGIVGDRSGSSVSMNALGNRVVIGAPYNNTNGTESGNTKIYQYDGADWTILGNQGTQVILGQAAYDSSGYSVSINALGDQVVIGSPQMNVLGTGIGYTRIYNYNGTAWIQVGSVDNTGDIVGDKFGYSVSINALGDRVVIGAPYNIGHTRIYKLNDTVWTQLGSNIDGEVSDDKSGYAVSMNALGDRIAIGAIFNDPTSLIANAGNTRIYQQQFKVKIGSYILYYT